MAGQLDLFGTPTPRLPQGMAFEEDFLDREDESALLAEIESLDLREAQYKAYTARRRIMSYGSQYDFDENRRSAYILRGVVRWSWQHSIAPTPALRYSITFRTRRDRAQAV